MTKATDLWNNVETITDELLNNFNIEINSSRLISKESWVKYITEFAEDFQPVIEQGLDRINDVGLIFGQSHNGVIDTQSFIDTLKDKYATQITILTDENKYKEDTYENAYNQASKLIADIEDQLKDD